MARLTQDTTGTLRFIELKPLGGGECARLASSTTSPTTHARRIGPRSPLNCSQPTSAESRRIQFGGARAVVGLISPVSQPYCGNCKPACA